LLSAAGPPDGADRGTIGRSLYLLLPPHLPARQLPRVRRKRCSATVGLRPSDRRRLRSRRHEDSPERRTRLDTEPGWAQNRAPFFLEDFAVGLYGDDDCSRHCFFSLALIDAFRVGVWPFRRIRFASGGSGCRL